ncbi:MAG: lipocalin-like domain-containing protein [Rhodocyclaceae bacterium]|nr:lipocalin-like domain-containing protein [Rhodocyclaceae bacterium]
MVGTWKLVSYVIEAQESGKILKVMGEQPTGYVAFLPTGRVFFMLTAEGREPDPAHTAENHAHLLDTMVAYTGRYRTEGDKWITKVEVAWNPEWVGTEQSRFFKLDGNSLQVLTPWRLMPNWAEHGMTRSIISFERAE